MEVYDDWKVMNQLVELRKLKDSLYKWESFLEKDLKKRVEKWCPEGHFYSVKALNFLPLPKEEDLSLLRAGQRIEFIKYLRDKYEYSLFVCKEVMEELEKMPDGGA